MSINPSTILHDAAEPDPDVDFATSAHRWTPVSNPQKVTWGAQASTASCHPVCRLPGCKTLPVDPWASDETADLCADHLEQARIIRDTVRQWAVKLDARHGTPLLTGDCGTDAGYKRHTRNRTEICDECRAAHNAAATEHRRGVRHPIALKPCGTVAAFQRHLIRGEEPCAACWDANRSAAREKYRRRKLRAEEEAAAA